MANIQGTPADDVFFGDPATNDYIDGNNGDDTVSGLDGNDQLRGGSGTDLLYGGDGNDRVTAGNGDDTVYGGTGDDYLSGGGNDDYLAGGAGADWLQGDSGNDRLLGQSGDDYLQGGDGTDGLSGGQGSDVLSGGADADRFYFMDADFNQPKGSTDTVVDFSSSQGDFLQFKIATLDSSELASAFASPGSTVVVDTTPHYDGVVAITITYEEGASSVVAGGFNGLTTSAAKTLNNDAGVLDTKIDLTLGSGDHQTIWVWNSSLTASDILLT